MDLKHLLLHSQVCDRVVGSYHFDIFVDPCDSNPCQNSGSCVANGDVLICSCISGFIGALCQSIDYCASNPCQNSGSCVNGIETHVCFCVEDYAGPSCEVFIGDIADSCDDDNGTCSLFSITRMDSGDRVNTLLSSVEYCSSIRAYCPDGSCSYCQCEFRLSYRHDIQRCDDYYNG